MMFEGITTALITPFDADGEVDEQALYTLIDSQIEAGINNLLVLGGTGEYSTLTHSERERVIDITIKHVNQRVTVMVGIVDPGLGDAIELGKFAEEKGADGILAVTPFYNKPSQEGIYRHYKALDEILNIPLILYNMPVKTGVNMAPETVARLTKDLDNIVAVKECSPNLSQTLELIRLVGDEISVLSGEEHNAVASMVFGAKGAVMATANLIPKTWIEFFNEIKMGNFEKVIEDNLNMYPLFNSLFLEGNPIPLKKAMQMKKIIPMDTTRLPLTTAKEATIKTLEKYIYEVE